MARDTNVLYLSHDGLTDPLGQSQILPYVIGLAEAGYTFTIISFEKTDRYRKNRAVVESLIGDHAIEWIPLRYHNSPPLLSTLFDITTLRRKVKEQHRVKKFNIVHCRSYVMALIGLWLKSTYNIKFIFDMRGFWADERVEGGLWNLGNPIFRLIYHYFKKKEKQFVTHADHIVVLTHAAQEEVASWGVSKNSITVIPCCVDLSLFKKHEVSEEQLNLLRQELGISPDAFVLIYLGSIGTWYLFDEMLAYFRKLQLTHPQATFLVLTQDLHYASNHANVIARTVSRTEVPDYIALANASICFIKPLFSKKGSSATKMAEVLAMGVPVITNPGWGDIAYLSTAVPGIIVESLEDGSIDAAAFKPFIPNETFESLFSLSEGVKKYIAVYQSV